MTAAATRKLGGTGKLSGLPVVRRAPVPEICDGAAQFARYVRENLRGRLLTGSQRSEMIREAESRGIGRFDANLIIAAVLHRAGMPQEIDEFESPRPNRRWVLPAMTFAILQSLIVAGAWWLLA